VLHLARMGYRPPQARTDVVVGGEPVCAALVAAVQGMKRSGFVSDHDVKIASKVAYVITGGPVAAGTKVSEQYLLDLEREAFLSLVGEAKSQERIQHMLLKGKPLRN
jgi:3-hydroxyacyl-CoA dehydrogenase